MADNRSDPLVRPAPLRCPVCRVVRDEWTWHAQDRVWDWDDEWWKDPLVPGGGGYTCSHRCWVVRDAFARRAESAGSGRARTNVYEVPYAR